MISLDFFWTNFSLTTLFLIRQIIYIQMIVDLSYEGEEWRTLLTPFKKIDQNLKLNLHHNFVECLSSSVWLLLLRTLA